MNVPARPRAAVTARLAAELSSRPGWNEPPGLYWVAVRGGRVGLSYAGLASDAWEGPAEQCLARIAAAYAEAGMPGPGARYVDGVAFRCEGWATAAGAPGTPQRSEAVAGLAIPAGERPGCHETRFITAVDRLGLTYELHLRRHDAALSGRVLDPGEEPEGPVAAALTQILAAVTGTAPPPPPALPAARPRLIRWTGSPLTGRSR